MAIWGRPCAAVGLVRAMRGAKGRALVRRVLTCALLLCGVAAAGAGPALAQQQAAAGAGGQGFTALARVDPAGSQLRDRRGGLEVTLALSQGVPYRIFTLKDPMRIVMDFREVSWAGVEAKQLLNSDLASGLAMGQFRPGWSRMVVEITAPLALKDAGVTVDPASGRAKLQARFEPVSEARFAALAGAPATPGWDAADAAGEVALPAAPPKRSDGPLRVLLDPGHGGIDPGAEREGVQEAALMLTFARELKEVLVRSGVEVYMTRNTDTFVSLEGRVAMAHALEADLFVSLHADALPSGRALGTTVHTLARTASDEATRLLAERHDRSDLLAGLDLSGSDDEVAGVLMDLARAETQPRSEKLADAIVLALKTEGLPLNTRPRRSAGYSVLKAPDVPSVLVETGFLSSKRDLENLEDPAFRARLAAAVKDGILAWKLEDDALAPLRLK